MSRVYLSELKKAEETWEIFFKPPSTSRLIPELPLNHDFFFLKCSFCIRWLRSGSGGVLAAARGCDRCLQAAGAGSRQQSGCWRDSGLVLLFMSKSRVLNVTA